MLSVVIVDLRRRVDADTDSTHRHERYSHKLSLASNSKLTLIVFQFHLFGRSIRKSNKNLAVYDLSFFSARKYLRDSKFTGTTPSLLVVGDPWESMFIARWLRLISRKNLPIQSQIHAALDNNWFQKNPINFLRKSLTASNLRMSDSIRVSDKKLITKYSEKFSVPKQRFFNSPVALNLDYQSVKIHTEQRLSTIGFVGRLHSERGIDLLLELLGILVSSCTDINAEIFGDGPEAERIRSFIRQNGLENRIKLHGYLPRDRHEEIWQKIGALVSTAETESYGRAIREALVHGIPVISLPTDGTNDIQDVAEGRHLIILGKNVLLQKFPLIARVAIGEKTSDVYLEHFRSADDVSSNSLILSWINLTSDTQRYRV